MTKIDEHTKKTAKAIVTIALALVPIWYDEDRPFPSRLVVYDLVKKITKEWLAISDNDNRQLEVMWIAYDNLCAMYNLEG